VCGALAYAFNSGNIGCADLRERIEAIEPATHRLGYPVIDDRGEADPLIFPLHLRLHCLNERRATGPFFGTRDLRHPEGLTARQSRVTMSG
jgi:hypothetical protein